MATDEGRMDRAGTIARGGALPARANLTLSEALVLGLLRQGVRKYFTVLGHGSTDVGEVLRAYQEAGLVRAFGVRSEIEASHAATALRWVTGEKAAVVTSIGPGALQAMAASLAPASDGIGVWYLLGDETTEDEGYNMQQVPRHEQGSFLRLAAIGIATSWAREHSAICFFDAGDVQANGFQVVEDERPDLTFTESGASYMGFAASALLATGVAETPFYAVALTGDGSFTMNPQILIDGAEHGAHGCILLLDNGRMGAITGLQNDQYGKGFATWNTLKVDYLAWGRSVPGVLALDGGRTPESLGSALDRAGKHAGLSLVHVPVYFGPDPLGGMGVWGRWNVGPWCESTQALRHEIGL